ncbi:MAG: dynamin family protein [archaeon]|nr:dynamin family protein [archaeon]
MEQDTKGDADNVLFKKLRKLINLIDQLRDCGVNEYIKLPRICSLGTQSSGKSSVLESIVGLDFLPRGDGVVTRRPLELRLCHINTGEPWAIFEERKGKKFTDFVEVRKTIEALTDEVCKTDKNIVDKPIVLNVYSQTCPDLTLVDLPGVTRVPVGNQPKNIEEITKNMAIRYIDDPLTIILCVIAANSDIATSDGLKLAKEIDTTGSRTLGVLTKLDIMDAGTDARKALMNEEIPLKLGYVGVKNRSKQDLIDKIPMLIASKREKEFFKSHPVYKSMPQGYLGTELLINKLTKIYFRIIRENLPRIVKAINDRVKIAEEELSSLGQPMPTDDAGKMSMLWNMLNEYCDIFRNVLKGKYDNKRLSFLKEEGGFKIKILYKKLLEEFTGDYKATAGYTDENINYALTIHEGDSIPGFPSVDAFIYLLRPQLEKLKDPIEECFQNVFQYLDFLSGKILERTFTRFPQAINDMGDLISNYLIEERDKTKYIVDSVVDMEINYLFTNDYDYLNNFTTFMPKQQPRVYNPPNQGMQGGMNNQGQPGQMGGQPGQMPQMQQEIRPQPPVDAKSIFIKEIRNRIEAYFKLIVRNLRDSIPKIMGNYLVKEIEENMQIKLYNKLYNAREMTDLLNEPESVAERRKELNAMIKVMKNAQKIIRRDPDLMTVMQININDSDIVTPSEQKAKEEKEKQQKTDPFKKMGSQEPALKTNPPKAAEPPKTTAPAATTKPADKKGKGYGNLFGNFNS